MKRNALEININLLIEDYLVMNSSYKVAKKYNISATKVKSLLKKEGILRTQSKAASIRNLTNKSHDFIRKPKSVEARIKMSERAKKRIGNKNSFYGKKHSEISKKKIGLSSSKRIGNINPNYKHGEYVRRPRDYKIHEFSKIRNFVFNRDKYTCHYCKNKGNHLHAHHILPYWVCKDAFLDKENLITVCTKCHFKNAHLGNWFKFDSSIVTDNLLNKYSLNRERLNDLATHSVGAKV